jgi:hypothetical protein
MVRRSQVNAIVLWIELAGVVEERKEMSSRPNDDDRTSPLGLFNYARSYRGSAEHLNASRLEVTHAEAPVTFLFYHAIELYLKAFLRLHGKTVEELRKALGHKVADLAGAAAKHGLSLDDEDAEVIGTMADADVVIRSRYIVTGVLSRPTEEALSRTCKSLDAKVSAALALGGVPVRPDTPVKAREVGTAADLLAEQEKLEAYIPNMNEEDREIVAYLLAKNQKTFRCDADGGNAVTLIAEGIVRYAVRPGQVVNREDVPMRIPDHLWEVLARRKAEFFYRPRLEGGTEVHPWRVHWMVR